MRSLIILTLHRMLLEVQCEIHYVINLIRQEDIRGLKRQNGE